MNKILISSTSGDVYSLEEGGYTDNLVPTMTSNTSPEGIASASSVYNTSEDYQPWRAFDKSTSSAWLSSSNLSSWFIQYEFNEKEVISRYAITSRDFSYRGDLKDFTFEGSNDGANWKELDSRSEDSWEAKETRVYDINNRTAYKMYRLNVSSIYNVGVATSYLSIGEISMSKKILPKIKKIPSQTEQNFINHGMESTQVINPQEKMTQAQYINNQSTTLGSGKVFEQPIDKYIKSLKVE